MTNTDTVKREPVNVYGASDAAIVTRIYERIIVALSQEPPPAEEQSR